MRASFQFIATALAFATGLGCRDAPLTSPSVTELDANRRLWAERGFRSYNYTIKIDCDCPVTGPIRAAVLSDSSDFAAGGVGVTTGESVNPRGVPSIKALFEFIDHGLANHAPVLRVTYDPTLGYPREIVYVGAAADDAITYTVSDVFNLGFAAGMLPPDSHAAFDAVVRIHAISGNRAGGAGGAERHHGAKVSAGR